MPRERTLDVRNFGPIARATVPLRDLVVLVGPQATGKSLLLQLLKLAEDRNRIVNLLTKHGYTWKDPSNFAALYFGEGLGQVWPRRSKVVYGKKALRLETVSKSRARAGSDAVFYIPAHRTITMADGWPPPFQGYEIDTPFVARLFSEEARKLLSRLGGRGGQIFPIGGRLRAPLRDAIDSAVFHGGQLRLEVSEMRQRLELQYDETSIPFMGWTSGQREFVPLLLGLYHLLTAGKVAKRSAKWVIIEEPEMGLHPRAVVAVMLAVLELLHRGYKVALSTHSQTVLDVVWALDRMRAHRRGPASMCRLFGVKESKNMLTTMRNALSCSVSVTYLSHQDGRVYSTDVSSLDPSSEDAAEANWGGLTEFGARVADIVADLVASGS